MVQTAKANEFGFSVFSSVEGRVLSFCHNVFKENQLIFILYTKINDILASILISKHRDLCNKLHQHRKTMTGTLKISLKYIAPHMNEIEIICLYYAWIDNCVFQ